MTPTQRQAAVEGALLRVAANVAKHTIQRSGWHEKDECFVADLRAAEAELLALVDAEVAAEREACARVAEFHAEALEEDLPAYEAYLGKRGRVAAECEATRLRKIAAAIRARPAP